MSSRGRAGLTASVAFSELPPPGHRFVGAPRLSPDGRRLALIAVDGAGTAPPRTRDLGESRPE